MERRGPYGGKSEYGSTTARGLGAEHQAERRRLLALLVPGAPCPFCRRPMFPAQRLDVDHAVPTVLGGRDGPRRLAHAACNRRHGARLGNQLRAGARRRGHGKAPGTVWIYEVDP